jgi:hypothetical protein
MRELRSTIEVMDALGNQRVAELTGRTYNAAHNWRAIGKFPANTYLALNDELRRHDLQAPPSLWGMS